MAHGRARGSYNVASNKHTAPGFAAANWGAVHAKGGGEYGVDGESCEQEALQTGGEVTPDSLPGPSPWS